MLNIYFAIIKNKHEAILVKILDKSTEIETSISVS